MVSSVRRPAERFASAWYWYNLQVGEHTLRSFADSFHPTAPPAVPTVPVTWRYRTGLDATSEELTGRAVQSKGFRAAHDALLADIAEQRIFLIVCDRFDASVLILRWLLQYTTHAADAADWMYIPQKVHAPPPSQERLQEEHLSKLDAMQPNDLMLYQAANAMLDRLIACYGPGFAEDLRQYQRTLQEVQMGCQMSNSSVCDALRMDNREAVGAFWSSKKSKH